MVRGVTTGSIRTPVRTRSRLHPASDTPSTADVCAVDTSFERPSAPGATEALEPPPGQPPNLLHVTPQTTPRPPRTTAGTSPIGQVARRTGLTVKACATTTASVSCRPRTSTRLPATATTTRPSSRSPGWCTCCARSTSRSTTCAPAWSPAATPTTVADVLAAPPTSRRGSLDPAAQPPPPIDHYLTDHPPTQEPTMTTTPPRPHHALHHALTRPARTPRPTPPSTAASVSTCSTAPGGCWSRTTARAPTTTACCTWRTPRATTGSRWARPPTWPAASGSARGSTPSWAAVSRACTTPSGCWTCARRTGSATGTSPSPTRRSPAPTRWRVTGRQPVRPPSRRSPAPRTIADPDDRAMVLADLETIPHQPRFW